jgi:hypothetical protein
MTVQRLLSPRWTGTMAWGSADAIKATTIGVSNAHRRVETGVKHITTFTLISSRPYLAFRRLPKALEV